MSKPASSTKTLSLADLNTSLSSSLETAFSAQSTDTRAIASSMTVPTCLTARYAHVTLTGLLMDAIGKSVQIAKASTQTSLKPAPNTLYVKLTPEAPVTVTDPSSTASCAPSQVHFIYRLLPKACAPCVSDLTPATSVRHADGSGHNATGPAPLGYQARLKRLYINGVRVAWEE